MARMKEMATDFTESLEALRLHDDPNRLQDFLKRYPFLTSRDFSELIKYATQNATLNEKE